MVRQEGSPPSSGSLRGTTDGSLGAPAGPATPLLDDLPHDTSSWSEGHLPKVPDPLLDVRAGPFALDAARESGLQEVSSRMHTVTHASFEQGLHIGRVQCGFQPLTSAGICSSLIA